MDDIIQQNLPQLLAIYSYVSPYIAPLYATFLHVQSLFYRFAYPFLLPLYRLASYFVRSGLTSAISAASSSSTSSTSSSSSFPLDVIVAVLTTTILLWLSLRALDFVRRQIVWWIGLATTLATWGLLLGVGVYVYQRGVEQSSEDAAWLLGTLLGWAREAATKGEQMASEREWDAERFRRAGGGGARGAGRFGGAGGNMRQQRPMGRGW